MLIEFSDDGGKNPKIGREVALAGRGSLAGGGGVFGYGFAAGLSVHVDYLHHPGILKRANEFDLGYHLGAGGWLTVYNAPGNLSFFSYGFDSRFAVAAKPYEKKLRFPGAL